MNRTHIALKYARALPLVAGNDDNLELAMSLSAEMMQLGFAPTQKLFEVLKSLSEDELVELHNTVIPELKRLKGAHVKHKPMYPNFPQQVMDMSHLELFFNAMLHYWSFGHWKPDYEELPREYAFEKTKFIQVDVISDEEFDKIFVRLVKSNESISDADKEVIRWFIDNTDELELPVTEIPYKENLCFVVGILLEKGVANISGFVSTATDILRIATHLSGGDISLAENTKFKSLPRRTRRVLVRALESVIREEDITRHKNKWVRLFHNLHVGEFSGKVARVAHKVRNNKRIETFNGKVEMALADDDYCAAVEMLLTRPGDFARRLDHLIRLSDTGEWVVDQFLTVVDKVPTRILLQVLGHFNMRFEDTEKRVIFPKGGTQRARVIAGQSKLDEDVLDQLAKGVLESLHKRFSTLPDLGKVYIDPDLMDCPVPTQQRSASEGLLQVARGTHLPIGDDKTTLRFFIYWKGVDIDLSATLHDENFKQIEHISYTHLKSDAYQACHSGDITRAPRGASEFIDITIDKAVEYGARYVVMNVLVFSGPTFAEHEECFAGWMTRSKPKSNEIFEPKTVEQRVDLRSNSRNAIPVVFDLVERKAIWTDLTTSRNVYWEDRGPWNIGNNVEANAASIKETLEAIVSMEHKVPLAVLFDIHAAARGELVETREEADIVFAPYDADVTPYDISVINSEYVVDPEVVEEEPEEPKAVRYKFADE